MTYFVVRRMAMVPLDSSKIDWPWPAPGHTYGNALWPLVTSMAMLYGPWSHLWQCSVVTPMAMLYGPWSHLWQCSMAPGHTYGNALWPLVTPMAMLYGPWSHIWQCSMVLNVCVLPSAYFVINATGQVCK